MCNPVMGEFPGPVRSRYRCVWKGCATTPPCLDLTITKLPARQRVSVLVGPLAFLLGGQDRGHGGYADEKSPGYKKGGL
jgi:hypothetical protein